MIKFFRKIRYNLMETGKTGKYFKYAIGEIVLVVIGILIALSINNWNENRLKRNAEIQFYKNTSQQLSDDIESIESQIEYTNLYFNQFNYAIKVIGDNDRSKKDSLGSIAINLTKYSDFDRQGNIYETAVNSGDVKLLKNNNIINGLRKLEETYIYINRMETIHFDALMSMIPDLNQVIRFSPTKVENEEMLYNYQFQNLFVLSLKIMDEKLTIYNRGINEIETLLKLMNTEIGDD